MLIRFKLLDLLNIAYLLSHMVQFIKFYFILGKPLDAIFVENGIKRILVLGFGY